LYLELRRFRNRHRWSSRYVFTRSSSVKLYQQQLNFCMFMPVWKIKLVWTCKRKYAENGKFAREKNRKTIKYKQLR